MLTRSPHPSCIECGKSMSDSGFDFHYGLRQNGPAYWSDEGVICSHVCAAAHFSRRRTDGREMKEPAAEPILPVAPFVRR
jgi:hypothetical protein